MKVVLKLGLAGPDLVEIFRRVQEAFMPDAGLPTSLYAGTANKRVTPDWLEKWSADSLDFFRAKWEGKGWIRLDHGRIVKLSVENFELNPTHVLNSLGSVPFIVCSVATIYPEWTNGALVDEYLAPSFGQMHWPHGWGSFFRGEGHQRLVSRRWLDFGPWRLIRGSNDTSLVQFHDVEVEAPTALQQARPGHEWMGISEVGGYIQTHFHYSHDLKGLYYASERKLHVVVPTGEAVTQREMLDACAARLYQILGPDQPIENVVYVFVDEKQARAHLHELWLRDLECRAFIDGVEVNLSDDYHPTPIKPEWVARLEE